MKRIGALFLIIAMLLALASCAEKESPAAEPEQQEETEKEMVSEDTGIREFDFEKKSVLLNSGYEMPIMGLGTYSLDYDTCVNSVKALLENGGRLIDTAYMYGNEDAVGEGVIVIPGSSNPEHIKENLDLFGFELSDEEMDRINKLDKNEKHEWY